MRFCAVVPRTNLTLTLWSVVTHLLRSCYDGGNKGAARPTSAREAQSLSILGVISACGCTLDSNNMALERTESSARVCTFAFP